MMHNAQNDEHGFGPVWVAASAAAAPSTSPAVSPGRPHSPASAVSPAAAVPAGSGVVSVAGVAASALAAGGGGGDPGETVRNPGLRPSVLVDPAAGWLERQERRECSASDANELEREAQWRATLLLAESVSRLVVALDGVAGRLGGRGDQGTDGHRPATVNDVRQMEARLMKQIDDFGAALAAFFDQQDLAIAGVAADVQGLKDAITALQNSQGPWTDADQRVLDAATARVKSATDKLQALDAMTAPVVPPVG